MPMTPAEHEARFNEWMKDLKERGKFSDETLASIQKDVQGQTDRSGILYVNGSQLRQQESDKWFQQHQETMKLKEKLEADAAALAKWRADAQSQIDKANLTVQQTANEKANLERLYGEARTKLATNYDVDESKLNEILPPQGQTTMPNSNVVIPPPSNNGNGNGNSSNLNGKQSEYLTRDDLLAGAVDILRLRDQERRLANQHKQLFGEELDNFTDLVIEADTNGQKLEDAWAAKYGVNEKRESIRKADFDAAVAKAFNDGKMQGQTERSIPTTAGMNGSLYGQPTLTDMLQDKPRDGSKAQDGEIIQRAALDWRQRQAEALAKQGQSST